DQPLALGRGRKPVQTRPSNHTGLRVLPEQGLLRETRAGLEQGARDRVLLQLLRHGLDLLVLLGQERGLAFGVSGSAGLLRVALLPVRGVHDLDATADAEDLLVGGAAEVERGRGRLAELLVVSEQGRAAGGEQLARAGGGEASAGDGVPVIYGLGDAVVHAGAGDRVDQLLVSDGAHFSPSSAARFQSCVDSSWSRAVWSSRSSCGPATGNTRS